MPCVFGGADNINSSVGMSTKGHRPCDHALQVAVVNVARRMSAGAHPMRENMGVAVDDHAVLQSRSLSPATSIFATTEFARLRLAEGRSPVSDS
jgi:hypothetical protein